MAQDTGFDQDPDFSPPNAHDPSNTRYSDLVVDEAFWALCPETAKLASHTKSFCVVQNMAGVACDWDSVTNTSCFQSFLSDAFDTELDPKLEPAPAKLERTPRPSTAHLPTSQVKPQVRPVTRPKVSKEATAADRRNYKHLFAKAKDTEIDSWKALLTFASLKILITLLAVGS